MYSHLTVNNGDVFEWVSNFQETKKNQREDQEPYLYLVFCKVTVLLVSYNLYFDHQVRDDFINWKSHPNIWMSIFSTFRKILFLPMFHSFLFSVSTSRPSVPSLERPPIRLPVSEAFCRACCSYSRKFNRPCVLKFCGYTCQ